MVEPTQRSFVGRAPELEALAVAAGDVRAGHSRAVLVVGQAGVGKTALLRRFIESAPDLQQIVVCGDEAESGLPYGLVDQLARACPGPGATRLQDLAAMPATDPLRMGAALLDLLGGLQAAGPVAVVVDDAQWADGPSLRALSFALRRLSSDVVLGLIAVREADAEALPPGLYRLVAERGARLDIGGLSAEELRELALAVGAGRLPMPAAERLRAHTGGSPLHARALFAELPDGALRRQEVELPAPRSFAVLVASRLRSCSPEARGLVQAAAVLGSPCPVALAGTLAEVARPVVALDEAVSRELLVEDTGRRPVTIAFPHLLVRAAVYADIGPARRTALHERAAELTTGEVALGHRVRASAGPDAALARELEQAAVAAAGRGAASTSWRLLLQAASLCAPPMADELLCDAMDCMLAAGDVASATAWADEVAALPSSARRSYLLGQVALFGGRQGDAEQLLVAAWEQGGTDAGTLPAQVATMLAQLVLPQCRASDTIAWSERALAAADADSPSRWQARTILSTALAISGRAAEGVAPLAGLPSSPELPPAELDGLTGRGLIRLWTDDLAGSRADLSAVVDAARTRPRAATHLQALGYLAEVQYRLGAWADATVAAERAIALCQDFDQVWLSAFVHAVAAFLQTGRGDWAGADAHVGAAASAAAALGDAASLGYAATARAELASARGDAAAVLDAVAPLVAMGYVDGVYEPGVFRWRELHADALVRLGRLDEAEQALVPLEDLARTRGRHSVSAGAARVRGRLEATRGAPEEAAAASECALAHLDGLTFPYVEAQIRLDYGRFLRRTGQRRRAAAELEAATGLLVFLGAQPALERCQEELAACRLHPTPRLARPVQLTPRELAVARLVAAGRSNREVAADLFVSVKTVEFHLSNVFAKRGLSSRAELVAHSAALRECATAAPARP